jgi:hypothetical protein
VIDRTHSRQFLPKSSSLRTLCLCVEFSDPLRPTSVVPTTYALPLATAAPQPVCNQSLTHSFYLDGDGYPSSRPANLRTFYRSNVSPGYPLSFHALAHSFALFCSSEKINLFVFMAFRTLRQKHGGGVPPTAWAISATPLPGDHRARLASASKLLYFLYLTHSLVPRADTK